MRSIAGTKRGHLGGLLAAILVAIVGVLAIPSMPATAATKSTYIFWDNYGPSGSGTTIGRANLDGTDINNSFITGASGPVGLAAYKSGSSGFPVGSWVKL